MPTHCYICAHLGFLHVCHRLTRYRRNADRATFSSSTSVCLLSFDDADCFMSFASLFSSDTEAATSSLCCSFISKDTSSILCVRIDVVLALYQRCSFRQTGQCEGPRIVERVTVWLHVLNQYVFCKYL